MRDRPRMIRREDYTPIRMPDGLTHAVQEFPSGSLHHFTACGIIWGKRSFCTSGPVNCMSCLTKRLP